MIRKIAMVAVIALLYCCSVFAAIKTGVIVDAGVIFTNNDKFSVMIDEWLGNFCVAKKGFCGGDLNLLSVAESTNCVFDYINRNGLYNTYPYLINHDLRKYGYYPILLSDEMREICKENGWEKAFVFVVENYAPGYSNTKHAFFTAGSMNADFKVKIRFFDYAANKFDDIGVYSNGVQISRTHSMGGDDASYNSLCNKALREAMNAIFPCPSNFDEGEKEKEK